MPTRFFFGFRKGSEKVTMTILIIITTTNKKDCRLFSSSSPCRVVQSKQRQPWRDRGSATFHYYRLERHDKGFPFNQEMMMPSPRLSLVVVVVAVFVVVCTTTSASSALECVNDQHTSFTISAQQINDNYCDCPFTGIDEPDTAACAGSQHWPGVVVVGSKNDDEKG